jgi:2,4-dienoyl-CoA reductase (NADPH2)
LLLNRSGMDIAGVFKGALNLWDQSQVGELYFGHRGLVYSRSILIATYAYSKIESMKYSRLLEPLQIGPLSLKNRVVMGSMHTGLEDSAKDFPKLAAYFAERAKGGVGLIVTGGFAPNRTGWLLPFASKLTSQREAKKHQLITTAVHQAGGRIALQILHAGRYAYHPMAAAPSAIKSPISPFRPWAMGESKILSTISDFAATAKLAQTAGYDGVEIMGSEGYLLNEFFTEKTNKRRDRWGGTLENRMRFPLEIVKAVRKKVGADFLVIFRISLMDLVEKGALFSEVITFAKELEKAGVSVLSTGIGWHEARVPTIATDVPRAAFAWAAKELKKQIKVPLIVSNRINTPEVAEAVLEDGCGDLISMARPLLADAEFVNKAANDKASHINTCIACNQGCLDLIFQRQRATCLVNPRACYETEISYLPAKSPKKIAVVGAGPAGLAFATVAASRGHKVTLFDKAAEIGGQFNLAKRIPGKAEFAETLRYYQSQLEKHQVQVRLNTEVQQKDFAGFDEVVLATGIRPRLPQIPGIDHPMVTNYVNLIAGKVKPGKKIAIIGAGGIGFDTAKFLLGPEENFYENWGIDKNLSTPGSLLPKKIEKDNIEIFLLQRKKEGLGKGLGKTTGWIHRAYAKDHGVKMLPGVEYLSISDSGLKIRQNEKELLLSVDQIVICAGQESLRDLFNEKTHLIGGAFKAGELDAKAAIRQGSLLGAEI